MQSEPSVTDTGVAAGQSMRELEPEDIRKIDSLLEEDRRLVLPAAIPTWHPGAIVDLLVRLRFRQAQKLFSWLPVNLAARPRSEKKPTFRATLLGGIHLPRVIQLVDELETDDASEVVAGLPPELAPQVVPSLEDRSAVQGLATGDLWSSDLGRRLGREVLMAVINGLSVVVLLASSVLLFAGIFSVPEPGKLALTAGMSLLTVVVLAGTIGATAPLVLHRMGIDPAQSTGPVIATSNDTLGVIVYFAMATLLYLG